MSYSRSLRVLLIEDCPEVVRAYEAALTSLGEDEGFDIVAPTVAGGVTEAMEQLASNTPIHVVVLDLKLPERAGADAEEYTGSGLNLLDAIVARENYPVPVLLILTGQPNYIQNFSGLSDRLQRSLYCGLVVSKGLDSSAHLRRALESAQRYVDFGVRICDEHERPWPPLTPREEDLIRRFGLKNPTYAGVDLQWWSAERKDNGEGRPSWSKVLTGRFWLREHAMETRPFFFKLEPRDHGEASYAASRVLEGALQHIQVLGQVSSDSRSLLVTAQATHSGNPPIALAQLLRRPAGETSGQLARVADDIADQLDQLGGASQEPRAPHEMFWRFHEAQLSKYDTVYFRFCSEDDLCPSKLLARLKSSGETAWRKWRSCQHGDLHLGNVSIDEHEGQARGFLIDAGSMEPGPAGKDLAALEIALVLHQTSSRDTVVEAVQGMYGRAPSALSAADDLATNTVSLLQHIRRRALQATDESTYRLLLLDQALIQLGALAYGSFGNKIASPEDAVALYRSIGSWLLPT